MRRALIPLVLLALPLLAAAQDNPAPIVRLKLDKTTATPGEDVKGTLTVTFAPGFHGYQNPQPIPDLIPVEVRAGERTTLKSVTYPKGHVEMAGGVEAPVYSGTVNFPIVVTAPKAPGKAKINLGFFYQQCDANLCFRPTTEPVSAEITVVAAAQPENDPPKDDPNSSSMRNPSTVPTIDFELPDEQVFAGESFVVTLKLSLPKDMFVFMPQGKTSPVFVSGLEGTKVLNLGPFQGTPRTHEGTPGQAFSGVVDIPVTVSAQPKAGQQSVALHVNYVPYDSKGIMRPQNRQVRFSIEVGEPATVQAPTDDDPEPAQPAPAEPSSSADEGVLGFINRALESGNWGLIIPAALLAGLALCLTPCVFPLIPVTVSFFSSQGSKTTGGRFGLGLFYALGIAITYGAAGGISAAAGGFVGELFTKPWFVLLLAALLIALSLSMFDVYEIRLPAFLQKNLKGRSGPVGALIMGLLMGFAAAPCAGALVGAVAVKVAEIGSVPTGLGMFGAIGLGMGLPFMVLATVSSGAKALPKSGGWLKVTKAVLGLVVLYVAFDYLFKGIGFRSGEVRTNVAWLVVFGGYALYLLAIDKTEATRAVSTIKGVAVLGIGILAGMTYANMNKTAPLVWVPYNEQTFEQAVASGKTIMIDGRADWCVQCKEIEHRVFDTPEGATALKDVYLMVIDWSTGVPQDYIDATTERFNIHGLPHIVFMKPGGKDEFAVQDIKDVEHLQQLLRRAGANP